MPAKKEQRKIRIDTLLPDRGLAASREKAKAMILAGHVKVNGAVVDKAGTPVREDADIVITERMPFVSRGGLKLADALEEFSVDVHDKTAMDVGASTGGFTDCLLQHGSRRVYAVDVGYGQFDAKLRNDQRVVLIEKTNIRYLERESIPEPVDIAVIDVSFISLLKVIPRVSEFLSPDGEIIALIKPQFEAGREHVAKGGVVKNETVRLQVIDRMKVSAEDMGFRVMGVIQSPIKGPKGNVEYLMYLRKKDTSSNVS